MKRVVVAGGAGTLGREVCAELRATGHRVVAIDSAVAEFDEATLIGGCDLADEDAVERAYDAAVAALGGIDGVVNVAGGFVWEEVAGGSADSWDAMYRINLRTAVTSSRAALRHLSGGGAIVNVGAAAVDAPGAGMAPYTASKAGLAAFSHALAEEWRARGVRVNIVSPTILDTPANRAAMPDADSADWVRPAAAAKVIAFLLSDAAACVTGTTVKLSLAG